MKVVARYLEAHPRLFPPSRFRIGLNALCGNPTCLWAKRVQLVQSRDSSICWVPTLDGTSGIGPIDTDVDMSAGDVFETLDGAFLGMYRGEGERWGCLIDVVYMDLKADGAGDGGAFSGEVEVEQTTAIASATYRLSPTTQLMAGALYNDVSAGISLEGPTDRIREQSAGDDWVDPIVGVLFETPIGAGNWSFTGQRKSAALAWGRTW